MVLLGILKGPLLETFQLYGTREDPDYYPYTAILFWMATLFFAAGTLLFGFSRPFIATDVIALLLWFLSFLTWRFKPSLERVLRYLPTLPRWYVRLKQKTGRVERRRIAYMWLHLPQRTRLIYNTSDRFFFRWAELVILATVNDV